MRIGLLLVDFWTDDRILTVKSVQACCSVIAAEKNNTSSSESSELKITITKSDTPIIWLDTSFLINIARAKLGRSVKPVDKERSEYLYEIVHTKTQHGRLICPIAHQRIEYDFGELPQECYRIQESLAVGGIRFEDELLIQFTQLFKVLRAHKKHRKHLTLSYQDAIDRNLAPSPKNNPRNLASYKQLQEWQSYIVRKEKKWLVYWTPKAGHKNGVSNFITPRSLIGVARATDFRIPAA